MSTLLLKASPSLFLRARPLSVFPALLLPKTLPTPTRTFSSVCASTFQSSHAPGPSTAGTQTSSPLAPLRDSLQWVSRTDFCGELSEADVGKRVRLCGWVALHRVHGGLTFLNLRDHTGIIQVTTLPDEFPDAHSTVNHLRLEYVVSVEGVVRARPDDSVNKKMRTGSIEVAVEHVQVLNSVTAKLPFLVTTPDETKDSIKEEIRLRYRCLDLRRKQMSSNIMLRHTVVKLIRRYLEDVHGFVEVD